MAELNIEGNYIITLEQLRDYFREEIAYGSDVFLELLDYGRRGDIVEWLRENGEDALARDLGSIPPSVGDAEFIARLGHVLTGSTLGGEDNLPVRPAFEECIKLVSIDTGRSGDDTLIKVVLKVIQTVNETYVLTLVSGWETNDKSITPSDYHKGDTIEWEVIYQKRRDVEHGEIKFLADGRQIRSIHFKAAPAEPAREPVGGITVGSISFKMVRVVGGTFTMGATPEQGSDACDDEKPAHKVTLDSFYIGETQVTQALWKEVMGSALIYTGGWESQYGKGPDYPAYRVTWDDCQTFLSKLNALTGKRFRLPTEAEWEFAARGGIKSKGYKYSGGNTLGDVAWYIGNSGGSTHPVAQKQANEVGLYDMSGNVFEWCSDWKDSYSSSTQTNPTGANSGADRVCRGGSWDYDASYCRSPFRGYCAHDDCSNDLGLRLCLSE